MAKIVDMPKLSPTMEEGQLTTWHKKEGDAVVIDDLLAEVETDKATMEFRSFDTGTILKILVPAGSIVKLGQPVAIIGKAGEDVSALAPASAAAPAPAAAAPAAAAVAAPAAAAVAAPAAAAPVAAVAPPPQAAAVVSTDDRVRASPYVRRLARERDLDLHGVAGSGPAGRVIARDLDAIAARPAPAAVAAPTGARPASERRPLSMMRKTIARRLVESKRNVPHFYLTIDVDAGALSALRETINADLAAGAPKGETPEKISINDLLIRAVAMGLARVPECNAQFEEDAIVIHHRVDVSVAVAVAEGLVTPVVRDADRKGVLAIAREVRALAGRARDKKLKPEEMTDGTFSISNLGMFGIDEFSAVINPPEGAILAVGRVRDEPVVQGGAVVPGKRLSMTLSCDHRVIDGAVGARFLAELRKLVEHPTQLLLS